MRIHRPVAEQVVAAITQTFGYTDDGRAYHADRVIERIFKFNRRLGSRDRKFVAEGVYDIVRWWRLLWAAVDLEPSRNVWPVLGAWLLFNDEELPDWPEFKDLDRARLEQNRDRAAAASGAVRESIPDWVHELGSAELGERWPETMSALNHTAPVILRANRLKVNREDLINELRREDTQTDPAPDCPDGLILRERRNVFATESFKFGYFEVQDGASQQASPYLQVSPGDRVIDGCAGAGGKTLHLAAIMKNKGKIIAMDVQQRKLEELRKRCTRAGVDIVEVRLIESSKSIKRMEKTADRVLLDVPCSGMGVWRRNPDSKWKLTQVELDRLRGLQSEILSEYSNMLKVGGRLVYATCSILPSENGRQVANFLATRADSWRLLEERQIWPGENGYDGFFIAVLERLR